jgi:hypothetical protein
MRCMHGIPSQKKLRYNGNEKWALEKEGNHAGLFYTPQNNII